MEEITTMHSANEETVAMNEKLYNESLAKTLLPEDRNYSFESINLISELDDNGEIKIDIVGRTDVNDEKGVKT